MFNICQRGRLSPNISCDSNESIKNVSPAGRARTKKSTVNNAGPGGIVVLVIVSNRISAEVMKE